MGGQGEGRIMPETSFEDFVVLVRQSGLPYDDTTLERLYDGYLKLRRMVTAVNRPSDLTTGLALDFKLEPVR